MLALSDATQSNVPWNDVTAETQEEAAGLAFERRRVVTVVLLKGCFYVKLNNFSGENLDSYE